MNKSLPLSILILCISISAIAQKSKKEFQLPDIPDYQTLVCDFHMHSVFSDGKVWPTTRVDEAYAEGLDVIAISDHIEWMSLDGNSVDLNRPYELARKYALKKNIILIHATEISRSMPPGHFNALFIEDANKINLKDDMAAIEEAFNQGAFIMWNHPGWKDQAPYGAVWYEEHTKIYENGWMHGIEVANWNEWYPKVLGWAIDKNLTILGNSDVHEPMGDYLRNEQLIHRPVTLVFAVERSQESIKEALFDGRTIAWFEDLIIGKEELLTLFANEIIEISQAYYTGSKKKSYTITNTSDIPLFLEDDLNKEFVIPAQHSIIYKSKLDKEVIKFAIKNYIIDNGKQLQIELKLE